MRILVLALNAALVAVGCAGPTGAPASGSVPPSASVPASASAPVSPSATIPAASGSTVILLQPPALPRERRDGLADIGAGLRGPAGTAATVVATGLANVASLAIDGSGRIWAGTASFTDDGSDAIYVIPGAGGDPVRVVSDLHTVLGLVWVNDTLYVASKEKVTAYSGFEGTAFRARRTVVAFNVGVGEVNEIVLSPAGRLVVGISAPCNACATTDPDSGSVLSFLLDGTDLRVDASGIRAPVGLTYFPESDVLYVTMNQRDDLADRTPGDWLAIVAPGQDWGFPDCYGQVATACSTEPAPVAVLDKHAAASGVAIVTDQLGSTIGTSALVAEWSVGTVLGVPLAADGFRCHRAGRADPDRLHEPVPLILDGRGGLLIGEWSSGTIIRINAAS